MKEALSKELLACLSKEIEARLGQFRPIEGDSGPWRWQWAADNLTFFILLQSIDYLEPRVRALAREAVDKLERYGLPLFQQVAEVRGLKIEVHRAD